MPPSMQRTRRRSCTQRLVLDLVGIATVLLLTAGCAAAGNPAAGQGANDAGFWLGLWQGFIAPIAFLVSLFNSDVGIYEVHNTGSWYDFGFVLGVSVFFSGGVGAGSRGRSRSSRTAR